MPCSPRGGVHRPPGLGGPMTEIQQHLPGISTRDARLPLQRDREAALPWAASRSSSGRGLVVMDACAAALAGAAAYVWHPLRVGGSDGLGLRAASLGLAASLVLLPALWVTIVALGRGYERRFLGVGSEEFRRIWAAGVGLVALAGTGAWAMDISSARGYVLVALPATVLLTLVERYAVRRRLQRARARGAERTRVVVVGHAASLASLVRTLQRSSYHGMDVVGACVPDRAEAGDLARLGVDVEGSLEDVMDVVRARAADTVVVMSCPELDGAALRRLGWGLEATGADMLVAPGLTESIGPRLGIRPVCGIPFLHVERPELTGMRRIVKGLFDRVVAALALLVLAPLLAAVAVAVRLDSPGPALFRQTRVGKNGREFTMLKFRTMSLQADQMVSQLAELSDGNGLLFKMRKDPRVTRVGAVLRKFSVDELTQLINVVRGEMSLVGPRPPLPREVQKYEDDVMRRFLVKPGLTGLWQISGRSDLSWDETVRLDLRYVDNWSIAFDFMILWKTASAVLKGHGAY